MNDATTAATTNGEGEGERENAPAFKRVLDGVTYDDVHHLRAELLDFCEKSGEDPAYAKGLALAVTEILTNLAKHPPRKARRVEIRLRLARKHAFIDVADDSAPFANFDAKCESALSRLNAAQSLEESGYGLGVILKQHARCDYTPMDKSPDGLNHFRVRDDRKPGAKAGKKPKVFLVDDDPVSLKRHRAMLEEEYAVRAYGSAEEAIPAFMAEKPDIVVSDLNMPGLDGIALRNALSELQGGNTTPFVFLSAETRRENSPYISALGVDDFLCKPVEREKLQSVVARLITRARQVRAALEGKFQRHLTAMLRPELPARSHGWRIVTLTEAAESGGGDFTVHAEEKDSLTAVLADVMGHGPQAKFFSYAYAGYLRSLFRMQGAAASPAALLQSLAQSIDGDAFLESVILTCQCFRLSSSGAVSVATAGHPAPFLARRGEAVRVPVRGPLPALASMSGYNEFTSVLEPGEKMVFVTDGFLLPFGGEATGHAPLLRAIEDMQEAHAGDMAEKLWRGYASKRGTERQDDATLIVAEYGGSDE